MLIRQQSCTPSPSTLYAPPPCLPSCPPLSADTQLDRLVAIAEKDAHVKIALLSQLLGKQGNRRNFDQVTNTKTIDRLMQGWNTSHVQSYLTQLEESFYGTKVSAIPYYDCSVVVSPSLCDSRVCRRTRLQSRRAAMKRARTRVTPRTSRDAACGCSSKCTSADAFMIVRSPPHRHALLRNPKLPKEQSIVSEALAFVAMQSFVTVESSGAHDVATPKSKGKGKTIDVTKFLRVARPPISERTREVRVPSHTASAGG